MGSGWGWGVIAAGATRLTIVRRCLIFHVSLRLKYRKSVISNIELTEVSSSKLLLESHGDYSMRDRLVLVLAWDAFMGVVKKTGALS